jgi:AraC-like DNA-binding protein
MTLCLGPRSAPAVVAPARFNHVKCPPSPALAPFVEHYWLTRWDRRGQPSRTAAALLDPCFHMHIQDGRATVMGVARGTYQARIEGAGCVVGVKFRPGGFHPFVPQPASRLTDRTVDVDELFDGGSGVNAAWAALGDAAVACSGGAAEHAALISTHLDVYLGARLPARDANAEKAGDLVKLIAANADVRRVDDLAQLSGWSERTLDRLFARYVGVSPAWVIRRYRLKAAAARLTARPPADPREVACELGYADQAHFIRDFRAIIGMTPGAYAQSRA